MWWTPTTIQPFGRLGQPRKRKYCSVGLWTHSVGLWTSNCSRYFPNCLYTNVQNRRKTGNHLKNTSVFTKTKTWNGSYCPSHPICPRFQMTEDVNMFSSLSLAFLKLSGCPGLIGPYLLKRKWYNLTVWRSHCSIHWTYTRRNKPNAYLQEKQFLTRFSTIRYNVHGMAQHYNAFSE